MEFKINIKKRHLFVFCIVLAVIGGLIFAYAYDATNNWANDPATMGHSANELEWSKPIMNNVKIGSSANPTMRLGINVDPSFNLDVGGNAKISSSFEANSANIVQNLIVGGKLGVGINPTERLDVNGNIYANGKIFHAHTCRQIVDSWVDFPSTGVSGESSGKSFDVPSECINNKCLLVLDGFDARIFYEQNEYVANGVSKTLWESSGLVTDPSVNIDKPDNMATGNIQQQPNSRGINGDNLDQFIFRVKTAANTWIALQDDAQGAEISSTKWRYQNLGWAFKLYVCA